MTIRINTTCRSITVFLFLISCFAQAQEANRKIKVFVIGNSFSQNATTWLPDLAQEAGIELKIGRAELGGCSLQRHWEIIEAFEQNPEDPKGKSYKGKSFQERFGEDAWDYVTIQQYSKHSTDPDTYRPYAKKIYDYIKALQPEAEIVMHQTWAYRADSKDWGRINENEDTKSEAEMYEKSRDAYHAIADELGVRILPVGDAFWLAGRHSKFKFQVDEKFNYNTPAVGEIPVEKHSLHAGVRWAGDNGERLQFDSHHANEAGKFLGSLVWSGVLFEMLPENVKFVPQGISPEFARHLKKTAAKAVKANKRSRTVPQN